MSALGLGEFCKSRVGVQNDHRWLYGTVLSGEQLTDKVNIQDYDVYICFMQFNVSTLALSTVHLP